MSNTPRTDAALEWVRPAGNDSAPPHEQYVSAEFARELERENAALREDRQKYASEVQQLADLIIGGECVPAPFHEVLARAKELNEDKARLDWLEGNSAYLYEVHGAWYVHIDAGLVTPGLRLAIDAARAAPADNTAAQTSKP